MDNLTTGSTHLFKHTVTKDGVVWDLTGAAVVFWIRKPDGTILTFAAVVANGPAGIVEYNQIDAAVFSVGGNYSLSWRVTLAGVVYVSRPISFVVTVSP